MTPKTALVRVEPVPGLLFEPRDVPPEEAAALVASGSFRYADEAPAVQAVTAGKESDHGAG